MLDVITSKIAMMIAAMIILATVIGIYQLQNEQGRELELRNIARQISDRIDYFNGLQGNMKTNITFDKNEEGIYIKPTVKGEDYDIMIAQNIVIIEQEGFRVSHGFIQHVHHWKPEGETYNRSEIEEKDTESSSINLVSGEDFVIERKLAIIDDLGDYRTFVYII
jgi:hypothetical protein